MAEKVKVSPTVCAYSNEDHRRLFVEVEVPGAKREDIDLKMHGDSFALRVPREDLIYVANYALCCPVEPDKAEATYKDGLLRIEVPYKDPMSDARVIKVK